MLRSDRVAITRIERAIALLAACAAPLAGATAQSTTATRTTPAQVAATNAPAPASLVDPYSARALLLAPFQAGKHVFSLDASGALTVRDDDGRAAPRVVLPAVSGGYAAIAPSPDGKYVTYAMSSGGRAFGELRVRDVATGRDLTDVLHAARIGRAPWLHNEKGFFYTREETPGGRERVYFHSLGRAESADAVIVSQFDHPEWTYDARVSDDGQYAVFTIGHPTDAHTRLFFIDMADPDHPHLDAPVVRLVDTFDARYDFVDNAGSYFFLQTDRDAPRGRVVLANTDITRETRWPSVVKESNDTLLYARTAGDQYVIPVYRINGRAVARVLGPPDPSVIRAEMRERMDSLRKARERDARDNPRAGRRPIMREDSPLRLQPVRDLALPTGASIVAINTVADQADVYYVVRLADGSLQTYVYDVKNGTAQTSAASAASKTPAAGQ